jgi:DNA-binding beta-propeller fold protein YncE
MSRAPGLYALKGTAVSTVVSGNPFVQPSGIAVLKSGQILVADASLGDNASLNLFSRSGIVSVQNGKATVFASGFTTGYPAGIALTSDETKLIVSAEAADHTDAVYVLSVANPTAAPQIIQDQIGQYSDSAAGLKRAHDIDSFAWSSLTAGGGGSVFGITVK